MKMVMLSGALLAAILGMSVSTAAERRGSPEARQLDAVSLVSAYSAELRQQRQVRMAMAPIRSKAQLDAYLARTPASESPIAKLSPGAQKRFIRSLTFNERGITGFRYGDLEMELSATQSYRILSLFGVEDLTPTLTHARVDTHADELIMANSGTNVSQLLMADYKDFWCASRATCRYDMQAICTGNC